MGYSIARARDILGLGVFQGWLYGVFWSWVGILELAKCSVGYSIARARDILGLGVFQGWLYGVFWSWVGILELASVVWGIL